MSQLLALLLCREQGSACSLLLWLVGRRGRRGHVDVGTSVSSGGAEACERFGSGGLGRPVGAS